MPARVCLFACGGGLAVVGPDLVVPDHEKQMSFARKDMWASVASSSDKHARHQHAQNQLVYHIKFCGCFLDMLMITNHDHDHDGGLISLDMVLNQLE
jgi:hypothetical protein